MMLINDIDTNDITFVVQGEINDYTNLCLKSIKLNFPESKIILSTWKGSNVEGLTFDKLVTSNDPGAVVYDVRGTVNNINRQLISTQEGMRYVKTKFAAKVRADLIFDGIQFLYYFNSLKEYNDKYKVVKSRLVALSMYTRMIHTDLDKNLILDLPYYVSDWFLFGYTEDVLRFYSAPIIKNLNKFSLWYFETDYDDPNFPFEGYWAYETPENYLVDCYFSSVYNSKFHLDRLSTNKDTVNNWLNLLVNNFIILDYEYSKIYSKKFEQFSKNEWTMHPLDSISILFYGEYLRLYKRLCDNSFDIPNNIDINILNRKRKLAWNCLIGPIIHAFKSKVKNIFCLLVNIVKWVLRCVLPSYRASCGVRERLLSFENNELEHTRYLIYRMDRLEESQVQIKNEIRKVCHIKEMHKKAK